LNLPEAEDEFKNLHSLLSESDENWEFGSYSENLKVQKRRGVDGT